MELIYKKKVDLSLFKYGFIIPQKLHSKFLFNPIRRGESLPGLLIFNSQRFSIRIGNADRDTKSDTLRILYGNDQLKFLMKDLFPRSYNYLKDKESGLLQKKKIPDEIAEYLYCYSTPEPNTYIISSQLFELSNKIAKNPTWHRDELILALDLYFRTDLNRSSAQSPGIIELSSILNSLPIYSDRPDPGRFRNPNGVYMKLMNFRAIDPDYSGKGLQAGGKLEKIVWNEFASNKKYLSGIAEQIKNSIKIPQPISEKYQDEEEFSFPEGRIMYRMHKQRERNQTLIRKIKEKALNVKGKLSCEVCGFAFEDKYGDLGQGYIECHHIIPLSDLEKSTYTKEPDLALVCSNCHKMLHRTRPWLMINDLRSKLLGLM